MNNAIRLVLFALGLACASYGVVLAWPILFSTDGVSFASWFVGGTIGHDALLAPVIGVAGLALARVLPRPWRAPMLAAAECSAVLIVLAIPELWRAGVGTANPGLHDRDYLAGLLIWLAGIVGTATVVGLARWLRARKR